MDTDVAKPLRKRPRIGIRLPVAKLLVERFRAAMPSNEALLRGALAAATATHGGDINALKRSASAINRDYERRAYESYVAAQQGATEAAFRDVLGSLVLDGASPAQTLAVIAAQAPALDEFFLSISQGRKKRAGGSLDVFCEQFFRMLGYAFDVHRPRSRRAELVFPGVTRRHPSGTEATVLMTKRVLRDAGPHITASKAAGGRIFMAYPIRKLVPAAAAPQDSTPPRTPKPRKKHTKTPRNHPGNHPATHTPSTTWEAFPTKNTTPLPPRP